MSSLRQNDLQKKPSKALAKKMARFFAKNGMKYEKRLANFNLNDASLNFLRSSEDPFHGYYKQKLSEYLAQIQETGTIVDDSGDDDDDVATNTQVVVEPPPGITRNKIESTARYVSKMGSFVESMMMQSYVKDASYSFLWMCDPFHSFYKQKLAEYRSQNQQDGANPYDVAAAGAAGAAAYQRMLTDQSHRRLDYPEPTDLPISIEYSLPKGMNGNEFRTMKLTAQFGAWYGNDFWLGFKNRAGFEFTNPTHNRFPRFSRFVLEYSQVFIPPKGLKEKVSKNDAYLAAIHDGFFRLIQSDDLQEMEWQLGKVKSMIAWHASLDQDFDFSNYNKEKQEQLRQKRQKFDKPAGLVPADQFLAQHPGWCLIMVKPANIDGCNLVVIEKIVQSLSESVASFKEKIAEEVRIPPEKQMLFNKAGLLLENNRSLAHYNVGAGETLTLSLCACGFYKDKPCTGGPCRCWDRLAKALVEREAHARQQLHLEPLNPSLI